MWSGDDKVQDFYDNAIHDGACKEGVDWFVAQQKKKPEIIIRDVFNIFLEARETEEGWATWLIKKYYDNFSDELRLILFKKINNPMTAIRFYVDVPKIRVEEEAILRSVWTGKVPKAEDELTTGAIHRVSHSI